MPYPFSSSYIFNDAEGFLTLTRTRHRPYKELSYTCNLADHTFTVSTYDACFPSPYCLSTLERVYPFRSIHLDVARWPGPISRFSGTAPCELDESVSDDPFDLESVARVAAVVVTRTLHLYDERNMTVGGGPSGATAGWLGLKPSL